MMEQIDPCTDSNSARSAPTLWKHLLHWTLQFVCFKTLRCIVRLTSPSKIRKEAPVSCQNGNQATLSDDGLQSALFKCEDIIKAELLADVTVAHTHTALAFIA